MKKFLSAQNVVFSEYPDPIGLVNPGGTGPADGGSVPPSWNGIG